MAANTAPIFVLTPKTWFIPAITTANTALDGTGTVATLLTAGADGSFVNKIRVQHLGSNTATVVRIFLNNGSANSSASNNALLQEITMASNSVSQTAASIPVEVPLNMAIAAGYKLLVTIGTSVASGIMVTADGGDY